MIEIIKIIKNNNNDVKIKIKLKDEDNKIINN